MTIHIGNNKAASRNCSQAKGGKNLRALLQERCNCNFALMPCDMPLQGTIGILVEVLPLFPLVGIDCGDLWASGRLWGRLSALCRTRCGTSWLHCKKRRQLFFAHPLPLLVARHPRAPASAYECTTEAGEDRLERMLQSLLASRGRVGKKKRPRRL